MNGFRVILTSPVELDDCVVEIWLQDELLAVVSEEGGRYRVELLGPVSKGHWRFSLEEFENALREARAKLAKEVKGEED